MKVDLIAHTALTYDFAEELDSNNPCGGLGNAQMPEYALVLLGNYCAKFCRNNEGTVNSTEDEDLDNFIKKYVIRMEHESCIEPWSATFRVSGGSRILTHQLVRHRIATYLQRSQRAIPCFKGDSVMGNMVIPPSIASNPDAIHEYAITTLDVARCYDKLIKLGVPKEDARFIVPGGYKSDILVTMNGRSLLNLLKLRLWNKGAQWEIKELMVKITELLNEHCDVLYTKEEYEKAKRIKKSKVVEKPKT